MKHFSLSQQWILFVLALLVLALLYFRFYHVPVPSSPEEMYREIVIEVEGEVRTPGIQLFREAPSLRFVLEKAGGFKETSLQETDSLPELLETGTLVTVTKKPSPEGSHEEIRVTLGRMEAKKLIVFSIPLNLNRVSVEDLCLIPGIGEPLAREIVIYRDRRKGFRSVEELKNIKGIGDAKWHAVRTYFIIK
jgi:competence protein ComEA